MHQILHGARVIGVPGRKSHFCELCFPEAQNQTNGAPRGPHPTACKHYRRDAPT